MLRVIDEVADCAQECIGIAGGDESSVVPIGDLLWDSTRAAADDRTTKRLRLGDGIGKVLPPQRGHHDDGCRREDTQQRLAREVSGEANVGEIGDLSLELGA